MFMNEVGLRRTYILFEWYSFIKTKYFKKPFTDNSNKVLIINLQQNFHLTCQVKTPIKGIRLITHKLYYLM